MNNYSKNIKVIVSNTLFLYLRMLLIMGISFYTTRVVLAKLGVTNFGVYNIIGGVVLSFSFITNVIGSMSQRFFSYEIGRQDFTALRNVFNATFIIHIGAGIIFVILGETIGMWFVSHCLNLGSTSSSIARYVMHFLLLTTFIQIIRIPFYACIIAYEKMNLYAFISIFEVIMKLVIAFSLSIFSVNKLILFVGLNSIVSFLILIIYVTICQINFKCCRFLWHTDSKLYKKLLHFSGWSLWGSVAGVAEGQGFNILINIFNGVSYNAALGISHQIGMGIYSFASNFQVAFNPRLVKSYAEKRHEEHIKLIIQTTKISFFLLFFFAFPLFLQLDFFIKVWLKNPPPFSSIFCRLELIFLLLDVMSAPLWMSVQATGDIKKYQLLIGTLSISRLPFIYLTLLWGGTPVLCWGVRIVCIGILQIVRIIFMYYYFGFEIKRYLSQAIIPILLTFLVAIPIPAFVNFYVSSWSGFLVVGSLCVLFSVLAIFSVGLTHSERNALFGMIVKRFQQFSGYSVIRSKD